MMTFRLWRALHHPPAKHPLFRRLVLLPGITDRRYVSWPTLIVNFVTEIAARSPTLLIVTAPLILVFIGLTYGIDCTLRVGTSIAKTREDDTFDVLSLSPPGAIGACWAICTSVLYRNRDFDRLREVVRGVLVVALIVVIIGDMILALFSTPRFVRTQVGPPLLIPHILGLSLIAGVIYIEYVQSAVLGVVVGLLIPTYSRSRFDTGFMAFGVFLMLQIGVYFVTVLAGFALLPALLNPAALSGQFVDVGMTAIRLLIFYGAREALIATLWRLVVLRLNVTPSELDFVMRPAAGD
jgi:hypothetical protein